MNYLHFAGVDVSKDWIDIVLLSVTNSKTKAHIQVDNNLKGFKCFKKWLSKHGVKDFRQLFISMEHTGVYTIPLCEFLEKLKWAYTLIPGQQIALSNGITRGKSDRIDALRIAKYTLKNMDELRIQRLPNQALRELKAMLTMRERLVKVRQGLLSAHREIKAFESDQVYQQMDQVAKTFIESATLQIKQVDQQIEAFIQEHPTLKRNFDLLMTVPGIGKQNALYMIWLTKNFISFSCPKKFASHAGIAPFHSQSGYKKGGGSKVSHKANKKMKALLTSAVVCSLRTCKEYQLYYNRQLEKGKNENSIKNVIRNKIVARAFAVIKRQEPYIDIFKYAA